jgi:sugar lactone lactonase YvrE
VWSVGTGSTVHELAAETARFNEIAISPDGRFMISGGGGTWSEEDKKTVGDGDYAIYVWRLPKSVWPQVAPTDATTPN